CYLRDLAGVESLKNAYWTLDEKYHALMRSRSWHLTKPLRDLARYCASCKTRVVSQSDEDVERYVEAIKSLIAGEPLEHVAPAFGLTPEVLSIGLEIFLSSGRGALNQLIHTRL